MRIGWPNTGDLLRPGRGRLVPDGYTFESLDENHRRYSEQFFSIQMGDIMLMPAYTYRYVVHVGVVVKRDLKSREVVGLRPGGRAYHYYHNISEGDWYECSHRVDVLWDCTPDGTARAHHIEGLNWRAAFSPVRSGRGAAVEAARRAGLPIGGD